MFFFFSSRRRHTRSLRDWSSDVCSSDLGRVTVSGENNAGTLRIRIRDTGIGIGTQDIPLVQQPFYRVNSVLYGKHQGAGLGLPFAKSVVELHGGTLEIESELDVGTTVTVTLPLLPLPVEAAAESSREPA